MANLAIVATQVLRGEDAVIDRGIAGVLITAGQAVYYDELSRRWLPSVATSTTEASFVDGIALNSAGPRQTLTIQIDGAVTLGAGAAPVVGTLYGTSGTAGALAPINDVDIAWYRTLVGCGALNNTLILGILNSGVLPGSYVNDSLLKTVIAPTQVSDNTPQVSPILDILGYGDVMFDILIGTMVDVDATFVVLLEEGDLANFSDGLPVADGDMVSQTLAVAPETAASWTFSDDDEVRKLGYIGAKRYLRLTVTPSANTGAADFAVYAVLGSGPTVPIQQTPA